jgi:type II secretory pathway pseudopilin PulG
MIARTGVLDGERGFTLIEVLVAALVLILIVSAGTGLFIHGEDSSIAAQRNSELISLADAKIETIRQEVKTEGFAALAMSVNPQTLNTSTIPNTAPAGTTIAIDPANSSFYKTVTGCGSSNEEYAIQRNYDSSTVSAPTVPSTGATGVTAWQGCDAGYEPLEILTSGFVSPYQTVTTADPGVTDTYVVDTFVTDTYVPCASGGSLSCPSVTSSGSGTSMVQTVQCPGSVTTNFPTSIASSAICADARRVTVAVVLDDHGRHTLGQSSPVYVSTIFTNPTPINDPTSSLGLNLGLQLG